MQLGAPRGIYSLLQGHKDQVKAVTHLPSVHGDTSCYLVSGADDKALLVWKSKAPEGDYALLAASHEHTGSINCVAALRLPGSPGRWMMATGSADATVKIWSFGDDKLKLVQSIKTQPKFFPLALSLTCLDGDADVVILAAAGTRDTVQILTAEPVKEPWHFRVQATLPGHEGWVRSLSFTREASTLDGDLLLASASQDKYIRMWRIHRGRELPPQAAAGSDHTSDAFLPGKAPSNKAHWLSAAGKDLSVSFEALLLGHEDWIYSTRWNRTDDDKLQLLSTSADNSLAIWEADATSGIWLSTARLGEISREKGATTATGSPGGFWTGLWSPDGHSVACLGRTGSWRRWDYCPSEDMWRPCAAISGHTKPVTGISWAKNGLYLLSTSSDQTTRLHMQWKASGEDTWHEMSRPQIHGYDLNCIDSLGAEQFVSGADEKLMRVFREPRAVASLLSRVGGCPGRPSVEDLADAADMPVLGLSNKAVDAVADDQEDLHEEARGGEEGERASLVKKSLLDLDHPPFEETLSRHTLWPEIEKLYGHGYEMACLAGSHDGTLIASACKASSTNHAVIRLFETEHWTELKPPLTAHSLTVTRLRFSADDRFILSVGRDRQWAVFERCAEDRPRYGMLQSNPTGHSRMILDAAWAPASEPLFATAGRDKQVKLWSAKRMETEGKGAGLVQTATLRCASAVTAVDFLPRSLANGKFILALGTEAGQLQLCSVSWDGTKLLELPPLPEYGQPYDAPLAPPSSR